MLKNLQIVPAGLLNDYLQNIPAELRLAFDKLEEAEISTGTFSFYTSVASVFSSKIEGENIELDSYIKYKKFGIEFLPDYTKKIDGLYNAYIFAQQNKLNRENISQAHRMLTHNILPIHLQGEYRTQNMYVTTPEGKIEYVAASPFIVATEMAKFYNDLEILINTKLSFEEIFFFAAFLHLLFVKIHPWSDRNGRCARLLEKWFLSEKLGEKPWYLQSEKHYYNHHQQYYQYIRKLGLEYEELDFSKALPFLLMLPNSLIKNNL